MPAVSYSIAAGQVLEQVVAGANAPAAGSVEIRMDQTATSVTDAIGTGITAPPVANGALSQSAGGVLAATTYYVRSTWVTPTGETTAAPETNFAVALNNVLNVAAPANAPSNATGWNVYVSTATGTETKQNGAAIAIGTPWVEPTTGLVAGAALPVFNTATVSGTRAPKKGEIQQLIRILEEYLIRDTNVLE